MIKNDLGDELWYRALCIKTAGAPNEHSLIIYFLDWGIEYSVNVENIRKMSKDFVYLPATAYKCYVEGNISLENAISLM